MEINNDIIIDYFNTLPTTTGKVIFISNVVIGIKYISLHVTRYTTQISTTSIESISIEEYMNHNISLRRRKVSKIINNIHEKNYIC